MFDPNTPDEDVLEKLRTYYPGLAAMEDQALWIAFIKIWDKLMALLCWSDGECNSLLTDERIQIVDLVDECFPLRIKFAHKNVTSVTSATIKWLTPTGFDSLVLANPDSFRNRDSFFLVLTPQQLAQIGTCDDAYFNIEIVYEAGWDDIPECFFSAIADSLALSLCQQNDCFGETEDCYALDRLAVNARLKSRTIGDEKWDWEVPNNTLMNTISDLQTKGMLSILGQYNNCFRKINFAA